MGSREVVGAGGQVKAQAPATGCSDMLLRSSLHGAPFNRQFAARCRKAGVRYINTPVTRKTGGTLLAALDVHPRVAMRILRHSKIEVTMEVYTEVPDDITRDALRRLGEHLDG